MRSPAISAAARVHGLRCGRSVAAAQAEQSELQVRVHCAIRGRWCVFLCGTNFSENYPNGTRPPFTGSIQFSVLFCAAPAGSATFSRPGARLKLGDAHAAHMHGRWFAKLRIPDRPEHPEGWPPLAVCCTVQCIMMVAAVLRGYTRSVAGARWALQAPSLSASFGIHLRCQWRQIRDSPA
jgi:hypothetical protein